MTPTNATLPPPRYRGLRSGNDGLRFAPITLLIRWRATLRFEPAGVVIVRRNGDERLLPWDTMKTTWSIAAMPGSRLSRSGVAIYLLDSSSPRGGRVWIPSTWQIVPFEELPPLCAYLAETPNARAGLGDGQRTGQLLIALATRPGWRRPRPPHEPMYGDKLDVYVAVTRAIVAAGVRQFDGRPIVGEQQPEAADIAAHSRLLLAPSVSPRITDDVLFAAAQRHLAVGAWPFSLLL